MRVLVVGQGGREHALCWKLKQSPLVKELYAAPGNAGIATVADCVQIGVADIIELADFAEKLRIDLTIVGPELPLALGIVDEFQKRGMTIFGPSRLAAELEASKVFSKEFMKKYNIPTAEATICSSVDEARAALKHGKYPFVIKVDGLLDKTQPQHTHVKIDRALGVATDERDVMDALNGHSFSPLAGIDSTCGLVEV